MLHQTENSYTLHQCYTVRSVDTRRYDSAYSDSVGVKMLDEFSRRLKLLGFCIYSPFLHYWLVSSFQINIGNTGDQNHPDLEVRVVLVTCIFNIDFFIIWKPTDNAKIVNKEKFPFSL